MNTYPRATNHGRIAYARWRALAEPQRALLERAVRGVVAEAKANPKIAVPDLERFMRDPLTWEAYAARAPADRVAPVRGERRFVAVNSEELRAIAVLCRIAGVEWVAPAFDEAEQAFGKRIAWPPLPPPALAAARFANGAGEVADAGWIELRPAEHRRQVGAWCEAFKAWTGFVLAVPDRLRVPVEWPSQMRAPPSQMRAPGSPA